MSLFRLGLRDFRSFRDAELELSPTTNLVVGQNASGKTTLLEAVHVLGQARSFRCADLSQLTRAGTEGFQVVGRARRDGHEVPMGLKRHGRQLEMRVAGAKAQSRAELAQALPVRILDSQAQALLDGGPRPRRAYLDWGVFHVEQGFLAAWRQYSRALRQRNEALKQRAPRRALEPWTMELAEFGEQLNALRVRYLEALLPSARTAVGEALGQSLTLALRRGWDESLSLAQALEDALPRDQARQTTTVGPHRADLEIRLEGVPAIERVSRGQGKVLAGTLVAGQLAGFQAHTGQRPTLLLDDLPAELDDQLVDRLWAQLASLDAQKIVTAIHPELLPASLREGARVFHVEHGGHLKVI
jgi:DNA replication and repair protein RecF